MISIRQERPEDIDAIRNVTRQAFEHSGFGHQGEAELIDRLRKSCRPFVSLVACADEQIVGHILFTPVTIHGDHQFHGMGLAPVSVLPQHQKAGIGSLMVQTGLKQLREDGIPFVVVLGHPAYYTKFQFLPAADSGITHGFDGVPQEVFFVNMLEPDTSKVKPQGVACYHPEFGQQRKT